MDGPTDQTSTRGELSHQSYPELVQAYARLCAHEAFSGSHVSIDRDSRGGETLNVAADWIEASGLTFALDVARELELEIVLVDKGLRLARYDDEHSVAVRDVKRTLAAEDRDE